tara:strand:- start:282 stop:494 length:213 start_codon:yes stop_codon:yes gene_type:complete
MRKTKFCDKFLIVSFAFFITSIFIGTVGAGYGEPKKAKQAKEIPQIQVQQQIIHEKLTNIETSLKQGASD